MVPDAALRERVRARAENRPGVYRMWGEEEELLYVGKSVRVRSRLLSYFRASRGEKPWKLIRSTTRITWEYVPNEFGALLREMRLIRRWRPAYNVEHKRRRAYAFVKITAERAPRLVPVSKVAADHAPSACGAAATYFGPFPRVGRIARQVRELAHVLGLRDCPADTPVRFGDQTELWNGGRAPLCMRADLGTCLAPCCGRTTAAEYRRRVESARRFLEGRGREPLEILEERMEEAASRMDYEYAALLRDRLESLRGLQDHLVAFRGRVRDLSFVYRVPGFRGGDRVYLIRHGRVREELPHPKGREERARVARRVEAAFSGTEAPPPALDPDAASEILLVAGWFRRRPGELSRTVAPDEWLERKRPA